ncbi:MAG: response regulator transcription factor [Prevotella sp.]|nr:response regulator transcription factor [Prevotella sp.]
MDFKPRFAIIDANTLSATGLRTIIQDFIPQLEVDCFGSYQSMAIQGSDQYVHYFVSMNEVINYMSFFAERKKKTIVLTTSSAITINDFHCLSTNVTEDQFVRSLLQLMHQGHPHGNNMPPASQRQTKSLLSNRELEVMSLIVQGYINKEIADKLNIGLTTVITHRKNIMEKLGIKSVSALTIYAVMNGYVDISKI